MSLTSIAPQNDKPSFLARIGHYGEEVSNFLFATDSIKKLVTGKGNWGDLANVGITAATFFIPPLKLFKLAPEAVKAVMIEGERILSNEVISETAKQKVIQTINNSKAFLEATPEQRILMHNEAVTQEVKRMQLQGDTAGIVSGEWQTPGIRPQMSVNKVTPTRPRPTPKKIADRIKLDKNHPLALYFDDAMGKHVDKLRAQLSSGSAKIEDLSQDNQYLLDVFAHFDNPKNSLGSEVVWVKAKDATENQIKKAIETKTRKTKSGVEEEWVKVSKNRYKPYEPGRSFEVMGNGKAKPIPGSEVRGNTSAPTEPEVSDVFASIGDKEGVTSSRGDNMGPGGDRVDFIQNYLDKVAEFKSLSKDYKVALEQRAAKKDLTSSEVRSSESLNPIKTKNISEAERGSGSMLSELKDQLNTLADYFTENHKYFNKVYKEVYPKGSEIYDIGTASGKVLTKEERLLAKLHPRKAKNPSSLTEKRNANNRKRIDKQDEALAAQENKAPRDFEESNFQGGTNLKVDSAVAPQLNPKKTKLAPSQSARAEMSELKADLKNSMDNLHKAKTVEEKNRHAKAVEQARKAIEERSRILGFTPPTGAAKQEQIDLANELFKVQDLRITTKRVPSTPKGTPSTRNAVDRARHVENIIAKENKDFVEGSPDYLTQLKNKKEFKNDDGTLDVEKYEKRMKEYQDEIDNLKRMQASAWEKTKDLSKQLNDDGIRAFMNRVSNKEIDPINRQGLINLIEDLADQAKNLALKKKIINYANKLKLQEGMAKGEAKKAGMNTRLAKEDAERKARIEAKQAASKLETTPKVKTPNASDITVHSGGAKGADREWAIAADKAGISTKAHSFENHTISTDWKNAPVLEERVIHSQKEIEEVTSLVNEAGKRQGKFASTTKETGKLVHRNAFQVKDSEAVLCITSGFKKIANGEMSVAGTGTPWAAEMAKILKKPLFNFDQTKGVWFKWDYSTKNWKEISGIPPKFKSFAGIGSRELTESGRKAIEEYMQQFMKGN